MKKIKKPQNLPASKPSSVFGSVRRPDYTDSLKFPDDITAIPSHELGKFLGQYTGLMGYALNELAKLNVEVLRWESEIFRVQAPIKANHAMTGNNQWQSRAILDMKTLEQTGNLGEAKRDREMTQAHVNILDRYINAMSREMTRRGNERNI